MDNLLVQIHFIVEMILVDRPCAMGVRFFCSGSLISTRHLVRLFPREQHQKHHLPQGLEFSVSGFGFRVQASKFRVQSLRFRVHGVGFSV